MKIVLKFLCSCIEISGWTDGRGEKWIWNLECQILGICNEWRSSKIIGSLSSIEESMQTGLQSGLGVGQIFPPDISNVVFIDEIFVTVDEIFYLRLQEIIKIGAILLDVFELCSNIVKMEVPYFANQWIVKKEAIMLSKTHIFSQYGERIRSNISRAFLTGSVQRSVCSRARPSIQASSIANVAPDPNAPIQ